MLQLCGNDIYYGIEKAFLGDTVQAYKGLGKRHYLSLTVVSHMLLKTKEHSYIHFCIFCVVNSYLFCICYVINCY